MNASAKISLRVNLLRQRAFELTAEKEEDGEHGRFLKNLRYDADKLPLRRYRERVAVGYLIAD